MRCIYWINKVCRVEKIDDLKDTTVGEREVSQPKLDCNLRLNKLIRGRYNVNIK